jgi:hypothetical protein
VTIYRNLNQNGFGGNYVTWYCSETLIDAGWSVAMSGSGTGGDYSASGDVFDRVSKNPVTGDNVTDIGGGSNDEHWGNAACWMVLESPSGEQLLYTRDDVVGNTHDDEWSISYSRTGVFSGGAAATPPTASDQVFLHGSGGPAAFFADGNTSNLMQIAADDSPSAAGKYGFVCLEFIATNTLESTMIMDNLGETAAGDPEGLALFFRTGSSKLLRTQLGTNSGTSNAAMAWLDVGGGGEQFSAVRYGYTYAGGDRLPGAANTSLYDLKDRDEMARVGWGNVGGFLGISRWIAWAGVIRAYPNTGDSKDLLHVEEVVIKDLFDGVTTPASI